MLSEWYNISEGQAYAGIFILRKELAKFRRRSLTNTWIKNYDDNAVIASLCRCCDRNPDCIWKPLCKALYDRWSDLAPIDITKNYDWEKLIEGSGITDPNWLPFIRIQLLVDIIRGQEQLNMIQ